MKPAYRLANKEDYTSILRITDSCINSEDEYHAYIAALLEQLDESALGVVALDDDMIIGVAICVKGMELTGDREDFFSDIRSDIGKEEIWSGSVVAVDKAYRKLHIGTELQKRSFSEIRKRGGRHLLLEIWAHPDGTEPSRGSLMLAPSYTDYGVVPDFYNIPSLGSHVCQICGTPCRCGARIAVLHLFPQIEYRLAAKADFEDVMRLCANYIDTSGAYKEYMRHMHDTLGSESIEVLAFSQKKLVGLVNARSGMHLTGERRDYFDEINHDIKSGVIWTTGFITVDPAMQGYGVARELQTKLFSEIKSAGVDYLLCEVWCRPDGYMPSRGLLRYGSESVKEYGIVESFYADIPRPEGTVCKVCGEHCRCKALIAVVKL